jgi:hypothetical protein
VIAPTGIRREPTILPPISLDVPAPPVQPPAAPPVAAAHPLAAAEPEEDGEDEDAGDEDAGDEDGGDEDAAPAALAAEERQKLKAALDELIACRRIIETALAQI